MATNANKPVNKFFLKNIVWGENQNSSAVKIFIFAAILIFSLAIARGVIAQEIDYTPLEPLPGIGEGDSSVGNLSEYLAAAFRLSIGLAALLAVVMITIGGFQRLSTDSIFGQEEGKKKIRAALEGLFLAMGAWLILYTINPKLVEFDFNISAPPDVITTPTTGEFRKQIFCYPPGTDGNNRFNRGPVSLLRAFPFEGEIGSENFNTAQTSCNESVPVTYYDLHPPNGCAGGVDLEAVLCTYYLN